MKDRNLKGKVFAIMAYGGTLNDSIPDRSKIYQFDEFIQLKSSKSFPNEHGMFIILDNDKNNAKNQFFDLTAHFDCFHLLQQAKPKKLFWMKTHGKDDVSTYLDRSEAAVYSEENLFEKAKEDKLVLITGKAGMGKSTILQNLSFKNKK